MDRRSSMEVFVLVIIFSQIASPLAVGFQSNSISTIDNESSIQFLFYSQIDSLSVSRNLEYPTNEDEVVVTANATDSSGIQEVILSVSFNAGSTWTNSTMSNTGGTLWSATILQQMSETTVSYKVYAKDNLNESSVSITYDYEVLESWYLDWTIVYDYWSNPYPNTEMDVVVYIDYNDYIIDVKLLYSTDDENTWYNVTMTDNNPDVGRWLGTIPGQPDETIVHIKVNATDITGQSKITYTESIQVAEPMVVGGSWVDILLFMGMIGGISALVIAVPKIIINVWQKRTWLEPDITSSDPIPKSVTRDSPTLTTADAIPTEQIKQQVIRPKRSNKVTVVRGGAIVGGKFEYKVKIVNDTNSVITNVTVAILAYPEDCMELSGSDSKKISRLEPDGFRAPQFIFIPTKDCVEGKILSTVSYIDHQNNAEMLPVEPYTIKSVCDLLQPIESTVQQFEILLSNMTSTSESLLLDWNSEVLFSKIKTILPSRNFQIIDTSDSSIGGVFTGTIKGLAEGKYTKKKVALRILISGDVDGNQSRVVIEGLGDDLSMLPTTIEEIATGMSAWICMNCGAAFEPDEVTQLKNNVPICCRYCKRTITINIYKK